MPETAVSSILRLEKELLFAGAGLTGVTLYFLLENIALGEEEEKIDRRRAEESLRAARLEDFVQSLSAGIDTPIGEAGNKLSGGQRQRIGIARASTNRPTFYSSTRRPRRSTAGRRRESTVRSPNCHNTTEI